MPRISAWSPVAAQTTNINTALCHCAGHRHHHSPPWQHKPRSSIWPQVATQATQINIALYTSTGHRINSLQYGPWIFTRTFYKRVHTRLLAISSWVLIQAYLPWVAVPTSFLVSFLHRQLPPPLLSSPFLFLLCLCTPPFSGLCSTLANYTYFPRV